MRRPIDTKSVHAHRTWPRFIKPLIISNVQRLGRLAPRNRQSHSENPGVRLGAAHLTGNDQFLEPTVQSMTAQNAAQSSIKVRNDQQLMVRRQIPESVLHVCVDSPGLMAGKVLIQLLEQGADPVIRHRPVESKSETARNEGTPPRTVIVRRWAAQIPPRRSHFRPSALEGGADLPGIHGNAMPPGKSCVGFIHRFSEVDERSCGIEKYGFKWHAFPVKSVSEG